MWRFGNACGGAPRMESFFMITVANCALSWAAVSDEWRTLALTTARHVTGTCLPVSQTIPFTI